MQPRMIDRGGRPTETRARWLQAWNLVADGTPMRTRSSVLLPVTRDGRPAMLKVPFEEEERRGGRLMAWWAGNGGAPVLAHDEGVVLLARADGPADLGEMARQGRDDEACRILVAVAARLHAPRPQPAPDLLPLAEWFRDLHQAAVERGGLFSRCSSIARALLADPREIVVLHGDLHHGNVLDFRDAGWLAIDPKGLFGERGFDFATLFINPDGADPTSPVAVDPGRFARRLDVVAEAAKLDRERLLRWIVAWCGLSAVWSPESGDAPVVALRVAELAAAELDV